MKTLSYKLQVAAALALWLSFFGGSIVAVCMACIEAVLRVHGR